MSVEGLHRLADELAGSTSPGMRVFGERMREELEGVVNGAVVDEEVLQGAGDTPDEQTPEAEEAPLPEEPWDKAPGGGVESQADPAEDDGPIEPVSLA